jgi:Ca2+-binding RTX toxin-like protein
VSLRSLTTGADVYVGGKGTNTVTSVIGTDGLSANGTSLNAGDNIAGGVGTADTLSVNITGNNTGLVTTAAVTLSSIENITVTNYETTGNDNSINLSLAPGVAKISVLGSSLTGDTLFTGARGLVTAEMGNGNGDLSITYVDTALAATSDVQTLNLTGQTGGSFSALPTTTGAAAAETVTITSGTSANTVLLNVPGATTINVSGASNLTLTESMTNTLTSVNATGFTGALNITTDDVTAINVVGGSGADTFTLGTSFGTTDTINGGDGADTLSIATPVASAAALAGVTSVEALTVTSGDLVSLAANVSPTTFNLAQSTAVANTLTLNTGYTNATTVNLGAGDTVTNTANVVLTLNATDAGMIGSVITGGTAADTLNLTASAATTVVTLNTQAIRVDTINIVDGGDTLATAGRDISITAGAAATSVTVNASALDAGVTGATDATGENLTYVGGGVTTATVVQNVTGGFGNDTISGGAGNDIISGGSGNDSLSGGTGNDSINAGLGDDTINMGSTLTSADSIDGGDGADKLILTTIPALSLTNVSNVETLVLATAGAASLSANVSFTTVDMDDGDSAFATLLTLATGYTNATTVLVDAGDSVTNTANAALTITATDAKMTGTTVTGGTGADTLNITATVAHAGAALTLASLITNVETINLLDGGDVQVNTLGSTVTAGSDMSLTVGNYASAATVATTLTIDASTLDAGTVTVSPTMDANYENATINGSGVTNVLVKLALTGGGGADSLTGGAGNDVIVGGAGNDQITPGTGNDNLSGGDDIDTFVMDVNLTFQDTINGGTGIDILTSSGGSGAGPTVVDADFTNVTLVETLTLSVGATLGAAATAAGIVTVNTPTTAAAVNAGTTTTGITFNALIAAGATQAQTLTGGTGADTFNFGSGTTTQDSLSTAETVNGGAGNDTLFISNSVAGVTAELNLNAGKVTNVENVTLGTASGLSADTAQIFALTITDITLTTVQTVAISGAAITDTKDTIAITNNATNAVGGTSFNITGGAGADTLSGGVNNDSINGGGGADSITGGAGADSLTGAGGADRFVYAATSATNVSTTIAKDTISDFTTGSDVLEVNLVATGSVGTYVGSAASLGEGMTLLSGRKGEWFYDTTTKQVHMDTDGNGLIQSTDLTINMGTLAAIAGADIALSIDSAATTATTGGAGADVFIVSTGSTDQSYDGGLGNDTFNAIQAELNATDVLVGGGGTDTLNISGTGTTTLDSDAKLATIENINLTGTATQSLVLTNQLEAFKVQMNAAGGTVTVNATVKDTLSGGAGVDNFTINTVDGHAFLPQATIAGADGSDIITLGLATTTLVDADFANVTSVERLVLTGASTIVLGTAATAASIGGVTTGNDTTSITSTQASLAVNADLAATTKVVTVAGTANFTVNGAGGVVFDRLTSTGTGTVNATFGDAGSNGITVVTGASNFTVAGSGATDTITVTGLNTAGQTFNGSTALGKFAIVGGAEATSITTGALADTVTGAGGADVIVTGDGNDQLIYLLTADLFTANALVDSITAGVGTADQLLVGTTGTAFAIASTDVWTRSSGLEVITAVANSAAVTIALGVSAETAGINAVDLALVTTVDTHLINASAYVTAGLTLTGSALRITSITGGGGADTILGGALADVIIGGGGADSITGGAGNDALTGGGGADRFNLSAIVANANGDTIGDFTAGAGGDIVQLGAYTGFVLGTLVTSQTVAGKSDLANRVIIDTIANLGALGVTLGDLSGYNNTPRYAYASDTGALFYDATGDWRTGSVQIGLLTVTGTVTAADNLAIITATTT